MVNAMIHEITGEAVTIVNIIIIEYENNYTALLKFIFPATEFFVCCSTTDLTMRKCTT